MNGIQKNDNDYGGIEIFDDQSLQERNMVEVSSTIEKCKRRKS